MVPFSFSSQEMHLVGGRALYWPREQALLVADMHLEKASFFARAGQMLPPYDSRETLERLALAIRQTGARRVFALGDNFHDSHGTDRIEPHAAGMLAALTRAVDWVWITGNHDADLAGGIGGEVIGEIVVAGVALRHIARPGACEPEISGHFHPRLTISARGRRIARPCAVGSERRMILPAFGALTGGLNAADPAILAAMQPAAAIDAIVPATGRLIRYPLWRAAA
ncbi:ligase-associated DNA damage response endonuclease PdeM [Novosphingobium album (ex Liu et al. 2023)]|uniref:Ligase-associated DNA damage response endonuclease PdeM n=1 Tax=Novosphingobium album (ex Liu et al. 2023) TaxID=3031130 RepID=A0ABT5WMQ9_9SPHN|nr:ligase-associated DNA damage response endonuclease PdeM [Novosphingobium album (ex Liu et al. 2023)]MDE8650218.1 ligase-associated DNA damage response endonuclease PdeM [Novosphingobium album (ex Liu et al. 2023)]